MTRMIPREMISISFIAIIALFTSSCALSDESKESLLSSRNDAGIDDSFIDPCGDDHRIREVYGPQFFERGNGKPITVEEEFDAPFSGDYCLLVVSGDHGPPHGKRVSSAVISVDGVTVIGPDSFNQNVGLVTRSIHIEQGRHFLAVQLRSKPGSFLTVNIRGIPDDLDPPQISIIIPKADSSTRNRTIAVGGFITDNSPISESYILVNGSRLDIELGPAGEFLVPVEIDIGEGSSRPSHLNRMELVAVDALGNRAVDIRDITFVKHCFPQQVVVAFSEEVSKERIDILNNGIGAEVISHSRYRPGLCLNRLPTDVSINDGVAYYKSLQEVEYATPNPVIEHLFHIPDDPLFVEGLQRSLTNTKFDMAWDITKGEREIIVAVIDTGTDIGHPDLAGNLWVNPGEDLNGNGVCDDDDGVDNDNDGYIDDCSGWSFCANDECDQENNDLYDGYCHGTMVAGIIGAVGDNARGVSGTNFGVTVMPIKISSVIGAGFSSVYNAAEALRFAVHHGAHISNHSYGINKKKYLEVDGHTEGDFECWQDAIDESEEAGHLVFASAGNGVRIMDILYPECDFSDPRNLLIECLLWAKIIDSAFGGIPSLGVDIGEMEQLPASFENGNVIAIGASDANHEMTSFSNYGLMNVEIVAPGSSDVISSTMPRNLTIREPLRYEDHPNYGRFSGTSAASPHAAGLAALMLSVNRNMSPGDLRRIMLDTARDIPHNTLYEYFGGRVVIENMVKNAICDEMGGGVTCWDMYRTLVVDVLDRLRTNPEINRERKTVSGGEIDAYAAVELARLTRQGVYPKEITVSLDGKTLAFVSGGFSDENPNGYVTLTLMRNDGTCLGHFPAKDWPWPWYHMSPSINEDGTRVSYAAHHTGLHFSQIRVASVEYDPANCFTITDDIGLTQGILGVNDIQPSISADGEWVAYTSDVDGDYEIFVARADGSSPPVQITEDNGVPEGFIMDRNPSICKDGSVITWLASYVRGGVNDPVAVVRRYDFNGMGFGDIAVIETSNITKSGPVITHDCGQIVFAGSPGVIGPGGDTGLFIVNSDGSDLRTLSDGPAYFSSMSRYALLVPFIKGSALNMSLAITTWYGTEPDILVPAMAGIPGTGVYLSCRHQEQLGYPYPTHPYFNTPLPLCEYATTLAGDRIFFVGTTLSGTDNIYSVPPDWDPYDPTRVDEIRQLTYNK